jgi:hypothetical protein
MPPNPQGMYQGYKFKVVGRVVLFVLSQLPRGIRNNFAVLHQHTTEALTRGIAVDYEVLPDIRKSEDLGSSELGFDQMNGTLFLSSSVIGLAILEKFSMNRR